MPDGNGANGTKFWKSVSGTLLVTAIAAVGWNYSQISSIRETEVEIRSTAIKQETIEALRTALELMRASNSLQDQNISRIDQLQKTNVEMIRSLDMRVRELERRH